jgi:hypothetical protein
MGLKETVKRLEAAAEACKPSLSELLDLEALTNNELLALSACYTDEGRPIPERFTPELAAVLNRVKR